MKKYNAIASIKLSDTSVPDRINNNISEIPEDKTSRAEYLVIFQEDGDIMCRLGDYEYKDNFRKKYLTVDYFWVNEWGWDNEESWSDFLPIEKEDVKILLEFQKNTILIIERMLKKFERAEKEFLIVAPKNKKWGEMGMKRWKEREGEVYCGDIINEIKREYPEADFSK